IAALVLSVFSVVPPLFFMVIVDQVLVHQRLSTLFVLVGGIFFVILFQTIFSYLRRYLVVKATAKIDARLSLYVF
ncbi:peptidase domain-containing ABC transporter, partial [bacterium]|nr:peptidase domain-containing ABC transporter [bacterium]